MYIAIGELVTYVRIIMTLFTVTMRYVVQLKFNFMLASNVHFSALVQSIKSRVTQVQLPCLLSNSLSNACSYVRRFILHNHVSCT